MLQSLQSWRELCKDERYNFIQHPLGQHLTVYHLTSNPVCSPSECARVETCNTYHGTM